MTKTTHVIQIVVEFEEEPSHALGDSATREVVTGRIRTVFGGWKTLPKATIEKLLGE